MGYGATYSAEFAAWLAGSDAENQQRLMDAFPEPSEWQGYYRNILDNWVNGSVD
jgi:hypothetical protein